MNCKTVIKLLPDYINNRLSGDQYETIKNHIESCNSCKLLYSNLVSSLDLLQPTKTISEQAFYYTRLKQKIENKQSEHNELFGIRLKQKFLQPVIYLSSIFLAVYIGILIGSNSNQPKQFSSYESENKDYIEIFAESQYLNDFEIETIENSYFKNDTIIK